MWNYKFSFICIINILTLVTCPVGRMRADSSSDDIFNKRANYEKNIISACATIKGYEEWSELRSDNELEFCQKYTRTLFSKKPRSVVSTNTRSVPLHFKEVKDFENREFDAIIVTALQCKIHPPLDGRKFIYFIRSPRVDCLYLLNQRMAYQYTYTFYIVEEICPTRKYKFYKICKLKKYEAGYIKKKKRNYYYYPHKNDSNDERRYYEMGHYENYRLKPEEYEKWPALREDELSDFCRVLMRKINSYYKFSKAVGRVHTVPIYYIELDEVIDNEVIPMVDVGALACEIPHKKRNISCEFIKAAIPGCVHLIKQRSSKAISYYIAKQLCDNDILQWFKTDEEMVFSTHTDFNKDVSLVDKYLINLFDHEESEYQTGLESADAEIDSSARLREQNFTQMSGQ